MAADAGEIRSRVQAAIRGRMRKRKQSDRSVIDLSRAHRLVRALPDRAPASVEKIPRSLRLFREGSLEAFYAPADYENRAARVAIVGLTPGWQQARIGYERFAEARRAGLSIRRALEEAKRHASFAGPMRSNLVAMLDALGLHRRLGLRSCMALFDDGRSLLHTTSALRYPVFVDGRNYSGSPSPTRSPALVAMVDQLLGPELARVEGALIIPLGKATADCLRWLSERGRLDPERWLDGLPHPSGANGHRVGQFAARRAALTLQVKRWFG